jgi:SAM-dependent methyltransferase
MAKCICGVDGGLPFTVSERQFGLGSEFTYLACAACGSLRIKGIPPDLGRYYPQNYYSFAKIDGGWRDHLQPVAMRFALRFATPRLPWLHFPWASIVQRIGISRSERVLDVGSGVDGMAAKLRACEYRKVLGIDPFIERDVHDEYGVAVKKAYLSEVDGAWDLIVFNHSLEHVPDPIKELSAAKLLLSPNGRIVVRIPIVAWAYREYGSFWYGLDAPRHLFIPTEHGFGLLVERVGMHVAKVVYDSTYLQFWCSENYQKGINLVSIGPHYWELITRSERRRMARRAARLNQLHEGDQAIFFLTISP